MLPSYRNQSTDLQNKSIDWFYMRATLAINGLMKYNFTEKAKHCTSFWFTLTAMHKGKNGVACCYPAVHCKIKPCKLLAVTNTNFENERLLFNSILLKHSAIPVDTRWVIDTKYWRMDQVKIVKDSLFALSRPYSLKFFKACLPQILYGPFLNTLCQL